MHVRWQLVLGMACMLMETAGSMARDTRVPSAPTAAAGAARGGVGMREGRTGSTREKHVNRGHAEADKLALKKMQLQGMLRDDFTDEELLAIEGGDDWEEEEGEGEGEGRGQALPETNDKGFVHADIFGQMMEMEMGSKAYADLINDEFTAEELRAINGEASDPDEDDMGRMGMSGMHTGPRTHASKQCRTKGCEKFASYGSLLSMRKVACKKHRAEGDVLLTGRKCKALGCEKQASYGPEGTKGERCSAHKLGEDVSLLKRCEINGCGHKAAFGSSMDVPMRSKRCTKHRRVDDARVAKAKDKAICMHEGCKVSPSFTSHKGAAAEYCKAHSVKGSINAKGHRRCNFEEGCTKIASFGVLADGRKGSLYCVSHKQPSHCDVVSKRCSFAGCCRRAIYGERRGHRDVCGEHRGTLREAPDPAFGNDSPHPNDVPLQHYTYQTHL